MRFGEPTVSGGLSLMACLVSLGRVLDGVGDVTAEFGRVVFPCGDYSGLID